MHLILRPLGMKISNKLTKRKGFQWYDEYEFLQKKFCNYIIIRGLVQFTAFAEKKCCKFQLNPLLANGNILSRIVKISIKKRRDQGINLL